MSLKNCETNLQVFSENSNTRSPSAEGLRKRIVTVIFGLFYNFFLFLRLKFAGFFRTGAWKLRIVILFFFEYFFRPGADWKRDVRTAAICLPGGIIRKLHPSAVRRCSFFGQFFRTAVKYCPFCFPDWLVFVMKIPIFEQVYRFCKLFLSVYNYCRLSLDAAPSCIRSYFCLT